MKEIILPHTIAAGVYRSKLVFKNKTVSAPRKTTMFEIEIPLESSGISYVDEESSRIEPGIAICVKPGQVRHTKLHFSCRYIHFTLAGGALYDLLMGLPTYIPVKDNAYYLSLMEKIADCRDLQSTRGALLEASAFLELLASLEKEEKRRKSEVVRQPKRTNTVDAVLRIVKENLAENLSLEAVAARVSLSPVYLHTLFQKATGKTLRTYVEELRLGRASELLTTTDKTLTEIAYECGFCSQSYFSAVFKRRFGITPREYASRAFLQYKL